jgi:hypothetical protein
VAITGWAGSRIFNRSSREENGMLNNLICLCVTGQPDEVKTTSGRIIIFTSYMTSLVLMAAYSAFLTSSLAVQHRDLPFRDLQGLFYDGSYRLDVLRDGSYFSHFSVCDKKIFLTRLLGTRWLRVRRQAGKGWKRAVSSTFYSVIQSKLTEVLNVSFFKIKYFWNT